MCQAVCRWCQQAIDPRARRDSRYCSKRCRQTAFRLRERVAVQTGAREGPLRLAYADPPYVGRARLYRGQPGPVGEVDHAALLAHLQVAFDGWALSAAVDSLRALLPLCPAGARVCGWGKPIGVPKATRGPHNVWEALIVRPARRLNPGTPDFLYAMPARGGGDLIGRKPLAFCAWLFDLLGALPGDEFADLYPGTGVVGHAWRERSRKAVGDVSRLQHGDG